MSWDFKSEDEGEDTPGVLQELLTNDVAPAAASAVAFLQLRKRKKRQTTSTSVNRRRGDLGRTIGSKTKKRKRIQMNQYLNTMDDSLFRSRYRMTKQSFWRLLDILEDHLPSVGNARKHGVVPNGPISKEARLSMALRIFAGGDKLDICEGHGVHVDEVRKSQWAVVDAIHASPVLDIAFPKSKEAQLRVALGFQKKSSVGIDNCGGAIDGILILIHCPTKPDIKRMGIGPLKFYCGRKKKFGLNMQAVCDARGTFLDIDIRLPGAASDYYAFCKSPLKQKLEHGLLLPGLALFGDNAYCNSSYMVVPFRNVSRGSKDAFNFFQSQLRINIECAFGILVHRWGLLRKPIPVNISVSKSASLVLALCKLHNFCIACTDEDKVDKPCQASIDDVASICREGGLLLPRIDRISGEWIYDSSLDRMDALLDGGEHMEDHNQDDRRRTYRRLEDLPYKKLYDEVVLNDYRRPFAS